MVVKSFELEGIMGFQLGGEVNITTSPELKKIFENQAAKKIIVDLEKVSYIDSSGLATLVEILKRIKSQGGSLALVGMSDRVRSLFEITKLDKLFQTFATRQDAATRLK